jgi:serine protease Do
VAVDALSGEDAGETAGADAGGAAWGVALGDLTPELSSRLRLPADRTGAVIAAVQPGSPAARAGLQPGDVLLSVNRSAVRTAADAVRALRGTASGAPALLLVWRGGQEQFVTMERR